ncbi:MAG: nucleotidyltransferase [Methanomassiliicoccaceae archaeon]|jgi:hypothetical protein|nr:nucleotidyltransferase [Methanomassiliicoccaceae archaeon]
MISEFGEIQSLFAEISKFIEEDVDVYLIGGGALMYNKSKNLTKDIDIVVNSEREFDSVLRSLTEAGFAPMLPDHNAYSRLAISQILKRDMFRIDLFCRAVCNKFSLSEGMMQRAKTVGRFGKIILRACSVEDIFLFKCMTERQGDLEDCLRINKMYLMDWNVVLNEAQKQSRIGEEVWITWITVRLEDLEGAGAYVPIMREMRDLSDRYIEKWERDLLSRNPDMA